MPAQVNWGVSPHLELSVDGLPVWPPVMRHPHAEVLILRFGQIRTLDMIGLLTAAAVELIRLFAAVVVLDMLLRRLILVAGGVAGVPIVTNV